MCVCVCVCVHLLVQIHNKQYKRTVCTQKKLKKCKREIKLIIATTKARFNSKEKCFMFSIKDLNLSNKLWNETFGAQFFLWFWKSPSSKSNRNYVEGFEIWCLERMETISWTDRVRNAEVLRRVKWELNVLHTRRQSKVLWTGHILSGNWLLKPIFESQIKWTGKWGIQLKQVFYDLEEMRKYCKMKEEAMESISGKLPLEEATEFRKTDSD